MGKGAPRKIASSYLHLKSQEGVMGKGGEDIKFLKIQTCVLKVNNLCCHGCQKKVKKVLSKIDGVYSTSIDVEGKKVTVAGDVDPAILIKKLGKAGKRAELWPAKSAAKDQNFLDQLQKFHVDHSKEPHKRNEKPQKSGGGGAAAAGGKNEKGHQPLQAKGLKDLNFPSLKDLKIPVLNKESKAGKADHPLMEETDEGSDFDDDELDEFEYDDEEFDGMDESDAESYDSLPKMVKPVDLQPSGKGEAKDKKGGGKGEGAKLENKSEGGKKAGGGKKDEGKNGQGGNSNNNNTNKGGNHALHNANPPNKGGLAPGQPHIMSQLSNMQGLPPLESIPGGGGYFHGGGTVPPETMAAAANPYQQQYLQALQQQRLMMMMNNQPMGYGYGYGQPAYMMPQPHSYTAFSEENPNSCSIM